MHRLIGETGVTHRVAVEQRHHALCRYPRRTAANLGEQEIPKERGDHFVGVKEQMIRAFVENAPRNAVRDAVEDHVQLPLREFVVELPLIPRFHAYRLAFEPIRVVLLDALAFGVVSHARERLELLVVQKPADADADRVRQTHREQIHREILVLREKLPRIYRSEAEREATAGAQEENVVHFLLHGVHVELAEVIQQHPCERAVHDVEHRGLQPGLFHETTKNGKNVNGEDRNRLVFVVVPVEQPDLAERGGGENAVAVVVEENAAFGGGFGVLADFLDGRLHAVETGVVETFELILGLSVGREGNTRPGE